MKGGEMLIKFRKSKGWLSLILIVSFINFMQVQYLFPMQKSDLQNNQVKNISQTGISGILNDLNGKPLANGIIIVTNEMQDILYGESLSKNNTIENFLITELPPTKELLVYAFHENFPKTIGFQKVYLKSGQNKKIIMGLNKDVLNPEHANSIFPNGRDEFYKKVNSLLLQSENRG